MGDLPAREVPGPHRRRGGVERSARQGRGPRSLCPASCATCDGSAPGSAEDPVAHDVLERRGGHAGSKHGERAWRAHRPVHDDAFDLVLARVLRQSQQRFGHLGLGGARGLGFQEQQAAAAAGDDEVDLQALRVAEVVELLGAAGAELALGDLAGDEALEHGAEERRALQLGFAALLTAAPSYEMHFLKNKS